MILPYHIMKSVVHHSKIRSRLAAMGHSLPMRSAPVSHHVRYALKADVTGKGWNGKTVERSRAPHRATFRVPTAMQSLPLIKLQGKTVKAQNSRRMTALALPLARSYREGDGNEIC
jgi:hypothetical protein